MADDINNPLGGYTPGELERSLRGLKTEILAELRADTQLQGRERATVERDARAEAERTAATRTKASDADVSQARADTQRAQARAEQADRDARAARAEAARARYGPGGGGPVNEFSDPVFQRRTGFVAGPDGTIRPARTGASVVPFDPFARAPVVNGEVVDYGPVGPTGGRAPIRQQLALPAGAARPELPPGTGGPRYSESLRDVLNLAGAGGGIGGGGGGRTATGGLGGAAGDGPEKETGGLRNLREELRGALRDDEQLTQAIFREAQAHGISSQAIYKHGVLTSEFIDAARKGSVTVRELGDQVVGTVGKFGAWTTAASLVYGAVGALSAVGRGAVDAASGVNVVNSVLSNHVPAQKARDTYASLSEQFNVPIKDSVDAVYGSAKVFQDFDKAVTGAKTSLFAMKVAELDAATASTALNGIVKGFGLSASDLPDVLDRINYATNQFGGNTGQLVQGVAKAAGSFRAAGGDYKQLIALLNTGSQLTGATSAEVGTAISRSAGSLLTKTGAERARAAGLDPTKPILDVYRQAASLYKQNPSGTRLNELSRALIPAGGQFARILNPLIENFDRFEHVYSKVQSDSAKGSAFRELEQRLKSPAEQVKRLVVELEVLGARLADSGALTPFVGAIRAGNEFLHIVNQLLALMAKIPGHEIVVPFLELAGAIKALRFFNVGGNIAPLASPGLEGLRRAVSLSPAAAERRLASKGLEDQLKFARDQAERTSIASGTAAFRYRNANAAATAAVESGASDEELARVTARLARAREAAIIAEEEQIAAVALVRRTELAQASVRAAFKEGATADEALRQAGVLYRPPTLTSPAAARPEYIGAGSAAAAREAEREAEHIIAPGGAILPPPPGYRAAEAATGAVAPSRFSSAVTSREEAARQAVRESEKLGSASSKVADLAIGGAAAGARGAEVAVRGAAGGLSSLASRVAGMVGPLELFAAGGFALYEGAKKLGEQAKHNTAVLDQYDQGGPQAIKAAQDAIAARTAKLREQFNLHPDGQGGGPSIDLGPVGDFVSNAAIGGLHQLGINPFNQDKLDQQQVALGKGIADAQKKGALLTLRQIQDRFNKALADGTDPQQALADARREVNQSYAKNIGAFESVSPAQAKRSGQNADDLMDRLKQQVQQQFEQAQQNAASQSALRVAQARGGVAKAEAKLQGDNANLAAVAKQYGTTSKEYYDALAQSQDDRDAVVQAQLALATSDTNLQIAQTHGAVAKAKIQLRGDVSQLGTIAAQYGRQSTEYKDALAKAYQDRDAVMAAQLQIAEAKSALYAARTADPIAKAAITLANINNRLKATAALYGKQSQEYIGLLTEKAQQQQELIGQELDRNASLRSLSTAQAFAGGSNQGAELARAIGDATGNLNDALSVSNSVDPGKIIDLRTQLANAQKAYADYVRQQAEAMVNAQAEYALSGTSDPVKQAQIALQRDRQLVGFAQTPADKLSALAKVRSDQRDKRNAVYNEQLDTINFDADIGKIDKDVQISRLQSLLQTIRGNKDLRRQIRRQIYQLKHDSSDNALDDVNIGDIKLPTTYEIRRAMKQGLGGQQKVTIVNQLGGVNVTTNNPEEVGAHIEKRFATSTNAALRSASL